MDFFRQMERSKQILVVSERRLNRTVLSSLLAKQGLSVLQAETVGKGFEYLSKQPVDAVFFDALLSAEGAYQSVRCLRYDSAWQAFKSMPCVIYANQSDIDLQKKAIDSGADIYLCKPTSDEGVEHVVETLVSQYNGPPCLIKALEDEQMQNHTDTPKSYWQMRKLMLLAVMSCILATVALILSVIVIVENGGF